jgi:adenylate kinase
VRIVLMGPPGAGKGTQGEILEQDLGLPRYATGDILRDARRAGTELGREARRYMDAGELVPDDVILGIVREALAGEAAERGFILDGFPRTVRQAEGLGRILDDLGVRLEAVVDIDVPDEVIVRRLSGRLICRDCGVVVGPEGGDGCPACGGELVQRGDDRPETVRRRLEVYREQTAPVLAWYAASTVPVVRVDGVGTVREVTDRVRAGIDR